MDVEISREGYIHHDRYERGVPVVELEDGLLPKIGKTKKTGTKVNFLPDDTIFEKTKFRGEEVKSRMHETAYLNPSLTIIYEDKRGPEPEKITYHEPDGILGFIRELNEKKRRSMSRSTLKGKQTASRWKPLFSMSMNFMRMCWASATISTMRRAEPISPVSRQLSRQL